MRLSFFIPMSHKLVVSATQMVVYVLKGHDFSRAINGAKTSRALAPEGSLFRDVRPFASIGKGLYLRWPTLDRGALDQAHRDDSEAVCAALVEKFVG